jgi:hypothetical protein
VWAGAEDAGFVSLFDGKILKGWHASAQTGHSRKSENKSGGRWVMDDGAITDNGGDIISK